MNAAEKPRTSIQNGRLWGAHSKDWSEVQEAQFSAAYEAVFDACGLGAGVDYCDIGCGSGMAAQLASRRNANVSGLDAAENLLGIAISRVPDGDFHIGDLEELPFSDGAFDLVTGFNSFQYAGNPAAALAQARRIAKPAGRIVVMTWGAPEGMEAASLVAALKPLLPPPPPGAPGPFALSEEGALRAFATSGGLEPLSVKEVDCDWQYPNLETALRGLGSSGVAARAVENSSQQAVNAAHETALAPFRSDDGSYRIGASFLWMLAAP